MRRLAVLSVLTSGVALLGASALVGTGSAAPAPHAATLHAHEGSSGPGGSAVLHGPAAQHAPGGLGRPGASARPVVVLGTVSGTTGSPATLVLAVPGGSGVEGHRRTAVVLVRLTTTTAVTGDAGHGAAYLPAVGDRVTVHGLPQTDRMVVALRVNVRRPPAHAAATPTVTTG